MSVRHLLARIHRLEQSQSPASPFEVAFGSLDAFVSHCRAGIDEGRFDSRDMPVVIASVEQWHADGVWAR